MHNYFHFIWQSPAGEFQVAIFHVWIFWGKKISFQFIFNWRKKIPSRSFLLAPQKSQFFQKGPKNTSPKNWPFKKILKSQFHPQKKTGETSIFAWHPFPIAGVVGSEKKHETSKRKSYLTFVWVSNFGLFISL